MLGDIDNWGDFLVLTSLSSDLLVNERPELVGVNDGSPFPVSLHVERSNTLLTEVTSVTAQNNDISNVSINTPN